MSALEQADWRRQVFALYAAVRKMANIAEAHQLWLRGRDSLFAHHPVSPLLPEDLLEFTGLPIEPYDPFWRFEVELGAAAPKRIELEGGTAGTVPFERIGVVNIPDVGPLDVWSLTTYGGGIFVPVKDVLAGERGGTYGGGRYVLDTAQGADLGPGSTPESVVLDFNFAFNPPSAYNPALLCPLAPSGNIVRIEIPVGERFAGLSGH